MRCLPEVCKCLELPCSDKAERPTADSSSQSAVADTSDALQTVLSDNPDRLAVTDVDVHRLVPSSAVCP